MYQSEEKKLLIKQEYLSKEILEAGFDPEEFQDYMLNHSSKPLDLNEWTIDQLKSVVLTYKKSKKPESTQPQDQDQDQKQKTQQTLKVEPKQIKPSKEQKKVNEDKPMQKKGKLIESMQVQQEGSMNHYSPSLYKYYTLKKKNVISELYVLSHLQHKKVEVKIKRYSKTVPDHIFKASYVQYEIECTEGWKATRRFNDFLWLRSYFETAYSGLPIPPIPEKTAMRSFDQKHIQYRMKALERFLNAIIRIAELCSDPIIDHFLRAEPEFFSQTKKNKNKELSEKAQSTILESVLGEGLLKESKAGINPKRCCEYDEIDKKYELLCDQLSSLQQSLRKASSDSFLVSSTFQEIQSKLKFPKNLGIFNVMYTFFNQFGIHLSKTVEQINDNIYTVWNYEHMTISNFNDSMFKIAKEEVNLNQKQKNIAQQMSEKVEGLKAHMSIPEPTKELKEFQMAKQKYKIKLEYISQEVERYERDNLRLISEEWTKHLRTYIGEISEWMIGCTDQLTRSMSLAEGKDLVEVEYRFK